MNWALFNPKNWATCSYVIPSKGPDKKVFQVSGSNNKYLASFRVNQSNLYHGLYRFVGNSGILFDESAASGCSATIVAAKINEHDALDLVMLVIVLIDNLGLKAWPVSLVVELNIGISHAWDGCWCVDEMLSSSCHAFFSADNFPCDR